MFAFRRTVKGGLESQSGGTVEVAFTDSSTDLGEAQGIDARDRALAALGSACGATAWVMNQVHGTNVDVVTDGPFTTAPEADALVTGEAGAVAVVRVADCVPVLLADVEAGLIGAAHAGRVGLAAGVIPAALRQMQEMGATHLQAWVGPHICGACYEVPEQMRAEVSAVVPSAYATSRWGTPSLDIGAGVISQLVGAGCDVTVVPGCTLEDRQWHSFRRDGAASGRMAGLIWRTTA